jgi:PAS domain S-box-containing protein
MDWLSIAALLTERSEAPLAVLDRHGVIRLYATRLERVLGWRRHEVEGRAWIDVFVPPEAAEAARARLGRALSGTLGEYECEVVSRDARHLVLALSVTLVGRGRQQGLLLTVNRVVERPGPDEAVGRDFCYQVQATASSFGALQRVAHGPPVDAGNCFAVLHQRSAPCADCPILAGSGAWPRTRVRARPDPPQRFEVITAEPVDPTTVRVSVRVIPEQLLAAVHAARIAALSERARLTERERTILGFLLEGRSPEEIAASLELSRRTVKFHQANVLQKLGADSRVDLIRLFGF